MNSQAGIFPIGHVLKQFPHQIRTGTRRSFLGILGGPFHGQDQRHPADAFMFGKLLET